MILLYNANVVDGRGKDKYLATLCLDEEKFNDKKPNKIIKIIKQRKIIDHSDKIILEYKNCDAVNFRGDYLIPLFIDVHCHSELLYLKDPLTQIRRNDYICHEVVGNCGISLYPLSKDKQKFEMLKANVLSILGSWPKDDDKNDMSWQDFESFSKVFSSSKHENKLHFLTGHSALRIYSMQGNPNREATDDEIKLMCNELDKALSQGSIGFSTGLYYAPCIFANKNELLKLLKIVKKHDAIFAIHRREEGNNGYLATLEAIELAKQSGVRLQISHLKAIGDKNQEDVDKILSLIDNARKEGLDVAFDQYPYIYGSTSLSSLLPPSVLRLGESEYKKALKDIEFRKETISKIIGDRKENYESLIELCGFDKIFIQCASDKHLIDKSISDIAGEQGVNEFDVFFDIISSQDTPVLMRDITQSEENLVKIMSHPLSLYGTDALYAGDVWHPRSTSASHEILKNYSSKLRIEDIVNRATLKSSLRFGLKGDFVIKEGCSPAVARISLN